MSRPPDPPSTTVVTPGATDADLEAAPGIGSATVSGALRVVIADDMEDAAAALAALLRHSGCEVWVARDGVQALQLVQQCQPHCVIYDVVMPFLPGPQLTQRIRALHGSNIVLIAMSGYERDDPRVVQTFDAADHYFVKPVDIQALARVLSLAV